MLILDINSTKHQIDVDPAMPLLWLLRDILGLTGTKYSCGTGTCGNCLVLLDGKAVPSCIITVQDSVDKRITTIEGFDGRHPLQQAWQAEDVAQCGYCTPGQIIAAAELLAHTPNPDAAQIDSAMSRVLCRCGSYPRIRRAIQRAVYDMHEQGKSE